MALYKKSSVEIPPVDRTKTTKKKDTIEVVKSEILSQREINEPSLQSKSQNTPSESFSLSPTQKIGLVGAGLLGITAGGSVYNYKTLNDYQNAMKKIDPSFKGDTKKAKVFNAIKDATKTTFTGKTKIPFGERVILKKPTYRFGNNLQKTLKLGTNPIENLFKKDKSINPTITQSDDVRFVTEIIDGAPQTRSVLPGESPNYVSTTDGIVKPNNGIVSKSFKNFMNKPKLKMSKFGAAMLPLIGYDIARTNADNPDKSIIENTGDAISEIIDPRNLVSLLNLPKQAMQENGIVLNPTNPYSNLIEGMDYVGTKINEGLDFVIDRATKTGEQIDSENETKRLYKTNKIAKQQGVIRRDFGDKGISNEKMKSTPDYTVLDIQKAVMYGDTKRSGLEALETISASTGIPTDKLLSEGRKMWSKRKK